MTTRRSFLKSILAAGVAPAFIGSSILMPVRSILLPQSHIENCIVDQNGNIYSTLWAWENAAPSANLKVFSGIIVGKATTEWIARDLLLNRYSAP